MLSRWPLIGVLLVACWSTMSGGLGRIVTAAEPSPQELEFFEKEIRPLLVKHCYYCHSAGGAQEGRLQLDHISLILKGGATGPAALPGDPKKSLLIEAVQYRGFQMPPNGKLPDTEIAKLIRWVEMGLPWPQEPAPVSGVEPAAKAFEITADQRQHWSFQPIQNPPVPAVQRGNWPKGTIDRFVLARMESHGLAPVEPAARETLLRRVTYDLTGMAPTPDELRHFLADTSSEAWPRVVDRLLGSPHYGERWGRHWMDVIRYADTAGDASDYPLPDAYKYRNYVIDSLNRDKPYDLFLREQYAGDLLAAGSSADQLAEQTIATTMLALSRRFGYNDTNFHYFHLTIADTLDTMGQSVLGLSIGCARCHDHKFEPISAKDYYALYGIFSSTKFTFPGAEEVRFPKDLIPLVPGEEARQREKVQQDELKQRDSAIQSLSLKLLEADGGLEQQAVNQTPQSPWLADARVTVSPAAQSPFTNVYPPGKQGVRLPAAPENLGIRRTMEIVKAGDMRTLFFNVDFRNFEVAAGDEGDYRVYLCHTANFVPAMEVWINSRSIRIQEGSERREIAPLELGVWYNLQIAVNLAAKTGTAIVSNGQQTWQTNEISLPVQWPGVVDALIVDAHPANAGIRPARDLDNLSVSEIAFPPAANRTPLIAQAAADWTQGQQQLAEARKARDKFAKRPLYPTAYAVNEGNPANTRLQKRGEPERAAEEVPRGFLQILGGQLLDPSTTESGRRELAHWLTHPNNPLTARVMANRLWHYHFGRGIVETVNDFGIRGKRPKHPDLLDYLATRFINSGWSMKALHREILLSATYQLSSVPNSDALAQDPDNLWLSHFRRRRMQAEELRDSLLQISGELEIGQGGPHPFPPIETWTFSQHNAFKAVYDTNLRSVYLMTQRIKRHPFLALFDGADPNTTTGQRSITTTPAQSLFLMNDQYFHQRSAVVAQRLVRENNDDAARIEQLFAWAYARAPNATEQQRLVQFLAGYRQQTAAMTNPEELAWGALSRVILSSNEFLHID